VFLQGVICLFDPIHDQLSSSTYATCQRKLSRRGLSMRLSIIVWKEGLFVIRMITLCLPLSPSGWESARILPLSSHPQAVLVFCLCAILRGSANHTMICTGSSVPSTIGRLSRYLRFSLWLFNSRHRQPILDITVDTNASAAHSAVMGPQRMDPDSEPAGPWVLEGSVRGSLRDPNCAHYNAGRKGVGGTCR
jgi:hypothetical protein